MYIPSVYTMPAWSLKIQVLRFVRNAVIGDRKWLTLFRVGWFGRAGFLLQLAAALPYVASYV